jgi:hypothetical protein
MIGNLLAGVFCLSLFGLFLLFVALAALKIVNAIVVEAKQTGANWLFRGWLK